MKLMPLLLDRAALFLSVLLCFSWLSGRSIAAPVAITVPMGCPPVAARRITQLYSWYLRSGGAYRERIHEQAHMFEPALYSDLLSAFRLELSDQAFLDFDPFNGVQTGSYGFRLVRCRSVSSDQLVLHMFVKVGFDPSRATAVPIDLHLKRDGAEWRIGDFEYRYGFSGQPHTLRPLLNNLLGKPGGVRNSLVVVCCSPLASRLSLKPIVRKEICCVTGRLI